MIHFLNDFPFPENQHAVRHTEGLSNMGAYYHRKKVATPTDENRVHPVLIPSPSKPVAEMTGKHFATGL